MSRNLESLRTEIKTKLAGLSFRAQTLAARKISDQIIQRQIFSRSHNIACYVPLKDEVSVWPVIKKIWAAGKNCYFPNFSLATEEFSFVRFLPGGRLARKAHNVLVPDDDIKQTIAAEDLDLVIVPLLGFNQDNFRLGRGAGCYDRVFSFKKEAGAAVSPYLIGVGYQLQQMEFKPNPWDVPMDEVISA